MKEKLPPHNIEAEKTVLGALMLEPEAFDSVQESINHEDFYKMAHQKIYQVIVELTQRSEEIDLLTVSHELTKKNLMEQVGGANYLAELVEQTLSAANIAKYAEIIQETSLLRKLIHQSSGTIERAFNGDYENVDSFLDETEAGVFNLARNKKTQGLVESGDIVKSAIAKLEDLYNKKSDVTGVGTGFTDLDKMTAGLHGGELIIIAARPSMGKTAFSLNIAQHVALREKKSVAYFSLEMGKESLMMRMLASEAKINMGALRIGKLDDSAWPKLIQAASSMSEAKFFVDETSGISPYDLRAKCRRLKAQHGLDIIFIDYLQLMDLKRPSESRERVISEISKTLKEISKELDVPVIALAQLNRGVESRTDRRPMLSDLRESGSIEQDADVIMMIYRDEYYEKENSDQKGKAEIIITKQRNGPTGTVRLNFRGNIGSFSNETPQSLEDTAPLDDPTGGGAPSLEALPPEPNGGVRNFAPGMS